MKMSLVYMTVILISIGFLLAGYQTATGYYANPDEYGFYSIWTADLYMSASIFVISALVAVLVLSRMQNYSF